MDTTGEGVPHPPQGAQLPPQQQGTCHRQADEGRAPSQGGPDRTTTREVRNIQGVGPPPRAVAGISYNQVELDNVVQHFLGTQPEGSPQGHGSPLVDTMAQASLFSMKD
eukprot:10539358-Karenia_brevis.AAC.1